MRVCEGCRREYSPKNGRQRFCSLTCPSRPDSKPFVRYSAVAGEVRSCAYCGASFSPRITNQRFCCLAHQRLGRLPIEKVLYNAEHRRDRKLWAPSVQSGNVMCSWPGCNRLIEPWEPWELGHLAGGGSSPQHRSCNRKTTGVLKTPEPTTRTPSRQW